MWLYACVSSLLPLGNDSLERIVKATVDHVKCMPIGPEHVPLDAPEEILIYTVQLNVCQGCHGLAALASIGENLWMSAIFTAVC
jgi:hypothetical protein